MSLPAYVLPLSIALPLLVILLLVFGALGYLGLLRRVVSAGRAFSRTACSVSQPPLVGAITTEARNVDLEKGTTIHLEVRSSALVTCSQLHAPNAAHLLVAQTSQPRRLSALKLLSWTSIARNARFVHPDDTGYKHHESTPEANTRSSRIENRLVGRILYIRHLHSECPYFLKGVPVGCLGICTTRVTV